MEIAKSFGVPFEPDWRLVHNNDGGGGGSSDLINFDPLSEPPLPVLPEDFKSKAGMWEHGENSNVAPYPSDALTGGPQQPPPLPTQPPVMGASVQSKWY